MSRTDKPRTSTCAPQRSIFNSLLRSSLYSSFVCCSFVTHFPHRQSESKNNWDSFVNAGLKRSDKKKQEEVLKTKLNGRDFHRVSMDNMLINFINWLPEYAMNEEEGGTKYCKGIEPKKEFNHMAITPDTASE